MTWILLIVLSQNNFVATHQIDGFKDEAECDLAADRVMLGVRTIHRTGVAAVCVVKSEQKGPLE